MFNNHVQIMNGLYLFPYSSSVDVKQHNVEVIEFQPIKLHVKEHPKYAFISGSNMTSAFLFYVKTARLPFENMFNNDITINHDLS